MIIEIISHIIYTSALPARSPSPHRRALIWQWALVALHFVLLLLLLVVTAAAAVVVDILLQLQCQALQHNCRGVVQTDEVWLVHIAVLTANRSLHYFAAPIESLSPLLLLPTITISALSLLPALLFATLGGQEHWSFFFSTWW